MQWFETTKNPPVVGKVVLGFWPTACLETVVLHANGQWNLPGYAMSEFRNPPVYWAEVPDLLLGYSRGE